MPSAKIATHLGRYGEEPAEMPRASAAGSLSGIPRDSTHGVGKKSDFSVIQQSGA